MYGCSSSFTSESCLSNCSFCSASNCIFSCIRTSLVLCCTSSIWTIISDTCRSYLSFRVLLLSSSSHLVFPMSSSYNLLQCCSHLFNFSFSSLWYLSFSSLDFFSTKALHCRRISSSIIFNSSCFSVLNACTCASTASIWRWYSITFSFSVRNSCSKLSTLDRHSSLIITTCCSVVSCWMTDLRRSSDSSLNFPKSSATSWEWLSLRAWIWSSMSAVTWSRSFWYWLFNWRCKAAIFSSYSPFCRSSCCSQSSSILVRLSSSSPWYSSLSFLATCSISCW